jgi:regulator of nucleoside diphosphate kinase
VRLIELLDDRLLRAIVDRDNFRELASKLARARIVESGDVPPDAVTMNSTVNVIDQDTGDVGSYRLVYPEDANIVAGMLSILAPIGTAILGRRKGDLVGLPIPSGAVKLRIDDVVQRPGHDELTCRRNAPPSARRQATREPQVSPPKLSEGRTKLGSLPQ